jgi:hypothetical protein
MLTPQAIIATMISEQQFQTITIGSIKGNILQCYEVHHKQSSETGKGKNIGKPKTLTQMIYKI